MSTPFRIRIIEIISLEPIVVTLTQSVTAKSFPTVTTHLNTKRLLVGASRYTE